MHSVAEGHDTPSRDSGDSPGLGVAMIDQTLPFQLSASVAWPTAEFRLEALPTARQKLIETQDTEKSVAVVYPDGVGVGWIDQTLPSQVSASGVWALPCDW